MKILRYIALRAALPLFTLFLTTGVMVLSFTLPLGSPKQLKHWLAESGVYNTVVEAVTHQSQAVDPSSTASASSDQLSLQRPEVQTALKQAFSPQFLQKSADNILDGTYAWLQHKTPKPSYQVDLAEPKQAFADSLAASARSRLSGLEPCSLRNQPTTTDPFLTNCQLPAEVSEPQIQKIIQEVLTSKDFLPQTTITADTTDLLSEEQPVAQTATPTPPVPVTEPAKPWYQQAHQLPQAYTWLVRAPFILGFLVLLLGALIVSVSSTWRQGLRTLAIAVISSSVLLALSAGLTFYIAGHANFIPKDSQLTTSFQDSLVFIIKAAVRSVSQVQLLSTLVLIVGAIVGLVILHRTKPNPVDTLTADNSKPNNPKLKSRRT